MATVIEVMAKLSGNSSGMVGAFRQASAAAEAYRDRVRRATDSAVDSTAAQAKAKLAGAGVGNGFAGGFKGALSGIGVLAATVGFGAMVKEAGAASDATEKFKATMNFAGLNTKAIDTATKAAKTYADQTVYDLPTIQNMIAQLASNGVKDYTGLTKAAGNLNAVAGGNAETFKSVAMTMTQTAGAGKLTTENWNQLSDAIPGAAGPLMKAMKDAGAYTGNFRDAMADGQITSDEFNAALMKLGTKPVAVEAAKSTKTFEGAIGGLQATINSGLMGALNAIKPAVTGAINGLSGGLGAIFKGFGAIYSLFSTGDFNGGIRTALGLEEDSGIVSSILTIRGGVIAMFAAFKAGDGDVTSSGFAGWMERVGNLARTTFDTGKQSVKAFFDGLKTGSSGADSGVAGALGKIGAVVNQTFGALKPAMAQVGPAFVAVLPSIMTLVSAFSPLGLAITALTPVIPVLAAAAGQLAAVLGGALAAVLQVVAPILAGIITGVAQAVTWFMSMKGSAEALAAGITTIVVGLGLYRGIIMTISAVTKAWAAVQIFLNAVMAINPVTLIIIGIGLLIAAIVLLVSNWDTVVKFITNIWGGFVNWIKSVMDGFVSWLSGIWSAVVSGVSSWLAGVWAAVQTGFNAVLGFITGVWNNISTAISTAWNAVVSFLVGGVMGIVNPIVAGFTALWGFITSIFTAIGNFITGVWTWVFNLVTAIGQAFWAEHGAQLTAAWNFIVSIFTGILNFYIGIWTAIFTFIVQAVTNIVNGISAGFTAAWNFIVTIATAIWSFLVSIFTSVWNFIVQVWNNVANSISAAWGFITGIIRGALSAVWGVISGVLNTVWGFISGIFNRVVGFLSGVWATITGVIRGAVSAVAGVINGWVSSAYAVISSTFSRVVGFLGGIWGQITAGVSGMVGQVGGFFSGMWGTITGALAGAGTWLLSAGRSIVQGLIDGIGQLAGSIGNAFLNMVPGWIVGPFKAALGIASPSKLFKQFGRWIVEGLIIGVHAKGAAAAKAVQSVADKLTKGAEDHLKRYRSLIDKAAKLKPKTVAKFDAGDTAAERAKKIKDAAANAKLRASYLKDAAAEGRMQGQLQRAAAMVQAQVKRVGQLATQKANLAKSLTAAQKKLDDATKVRNTKAADVSKNLSGEFDLGALVGYSAKDVVVQTKLIGDRIRKFGDKIKALKKAGLSAAMIDQVSALGSQDGTIMADSLLKGGKGVIAQMNSAYAGIGAASNSAGAFVADGMYKSGIDAAKGLVKGIQSQIKKVDGAATAIAKQLVKRFRTELGIKSPSKVMEGEAGWVMAGVDRGLEKGTGAVLGTMEKAAKGIAAVSLNAPKVVMPQVPDIASQLALPELVQNVRLNFTGGTPEEALRNLTAAVKARGVDGALQAYDGATLAARNAAYGAPVPEVVVNVRAVVTNPFTGQEVEAIVRDVAVETAQKSLTLTARAAKARRGVGVGG